MLNEIPEFDLRDSLRYAPEISPLLRENPRNLLAYADAARPDFFAIVNRVGPYLTIVGDAIKDALPKPDPDQMYLYKGELPSFKSVVVSVADALSTVHPNYLLVSFTFVGAFFILYIKTKYPFWNQIPALHVYDWHRRFLYPENPYIVHILPKKTKYYEPRLITTTRFSDLADDKRAEMTALLQNHYLPSDRVFFSGQLPDLAAQCGNALVSFYSDLRICVASSESANMQEFTDAYYNLVQEDVERTRTDANIIQSVSKIRKIEGLVTSRPLQISVSINKDKDDGERRIVLEHAQFIEYLCFDKRAASSHKIRQLFHTHEYNQRLLYPSKNITLFKKEVDLCDALVPLVKYDAFTFYLRYRIDGPKLPANWQMVRIQKEHQQHLHDYIGRVASLKDLAQPGFRVSLVAEIGDLITLLQTNQLFAYVLRGPDPEISTRLDAVYAIYFFRNAHMKYEDLDAGDTVHFVGAFCNTRNTELYFAGFLQGLREVIKDFSGTPKMLMMDDLGHSRPIVKKWRETHDVILQTPCAYYLCNYVVPRSPYREEDVLVLL